MIQFVPEYFPPLASMRSLALASAFQMNAESPYVKQTYLNRTRIRTPQGAHWLTIPVKKLPSGTALTEIEIDPSSSWRQDHTKGLVYNYATSPYFEYYEPAIRGLIEADWVFLKDLTEKTTRWCITTLGLAVSEVNADFVADSDLKNIDTDENGLPTPFIHPEYRQNFDGFVPGLSVLDLLFNHGPNSKGILLSGR